MKLRVVAVLLALSAIVALAQGQERDIDPYMTKEWVAPGVTAVLIEENEKEPAKKAEDAAHEELRAVKKAMTDAFNKKDIDALLKHVHPDVVVTWQNGEVSRGPQEIRKYYERMMVGDNSVLLGVTADPEVTDLSRLIGDPPHTAIAYGKLNDKYTLRDGTNIDMNSLFSATAVKHEGRWVVINFHASTNVFDNSVLRVAVTRTMWWSALVAGLVALLLLGLIIGRIVAPRKAAP